MKRKAESAAESVANAVKAWPCVDSVVLGEPISEDLFDPYFFLSIDVYHTGSVPPVEARMESFSFGVAFESAQSNRKDRFLAGDIPIRIEYKDTQRIDNLVDGREGLLASLRDSGTYVFYRILNSDILHNRSDWFLRIRRRLEEMPRSFWSLLRYSFQARMEHYLSDMGAAVMRADELFFLISLAGFVRSACSVLFAVNQRFEPSFRLLSEQVRKLPVLPESFPGRFESLMRTGSELSPPQKREIAELLAKSILIL